jgi:3-keto-5-aminohexanoate cleavage enzyme
MSDNKVVITAALTGVLATREQCPYIPYTPEEIAEEGRRAVEAGAAILHIHARQPNGLPAFDVETYRQIYEEVRKRNPDVIINFLRLNVSTTTSSFRIPSGTFSTS